MIIQNLNLYSRRIKKTIIIVESILCLIAIFLLIICVLGQILASDEQNYTFEILTKISSGIWSLGIISFIDLVTLFCCKTNISLKIIHKFTKKEFTLNLTQEQEKVIATYFADANNDLIKHLVIINGPAKRGKSECVDILLEKFFFQSSKNTDIITRKLIFIDCYNDSIKTSNFINSLKLDDQNKNFIVIDNCNEAEYSIVSKLADLHDKHNCSVLLIEENCDYFKNHSDLSQCEKIDFTSLMIDDKGNIEEFIKKEKMNQLKKQILFVINYFYSYFNICSWSDIVKTLDLNNLNKIKGHLFTHKLIQKNILRYFPNSSKYFRFKSCFDSKYIRDSKLQDSELLEKTIKHLHNHEENEEVKWLSLLDLSPATLINEYSQEYRKDLFYQALEIGNYNKLLSALKDYTAKYNCSIFFNYELAVLHYNIGNYTDAINYFKQINGNSATHYDGLISTLHGCKDENVRNEVNQYILNLKKINKTYGEYWDCHINSEHGIFDIEKLQNVQEALHSEYLNEKNGLSLILLERCITDELRWIWILQNKEEADYNQRLEILKGLHKNLFKDKNNVGYYNALYFSAGHIHYYTIPIMMWLNKNYHVNQNQFDIQLNSNYQVLFDKAVKDYNAAINSQYEKQKSKQAARVKLADLLSMSYDFDYLVCKKEVLNFKQYAIKQNIDVFIAYSNTLLAKLMILQTMKIQGSSFEKDTINKIYRLLEDAHNIYSEYNNEYGIKRCEYIKLLFNLMQYFDYDNAKFETELNALEKFSETCVGLEQKFIKPIINSTRNKYMYIYNSLKFYPIILQ